MVSHICHKSVNRTVPVSPATLADGRAYIEIERTLYALSLADGSIVWQLDDVGACAGGPLVDDDGTIYLSGYYGPHLLAVSKDGRELWRASDVDDDYYRSYKLTKEGDYLKVYYESREGYKRRIIFCLINRQPCAINSILAIKGRAVVYCMSIVSLPLFKGPKVQEEVKRREQI